MAVQLKTPTASNDVFKSAANVHIAGGTITAIQNNISPISDKNDLSENTKLLRSKLSWNAILNEAGKADPVRCYPGTREAIMKHIENWIGGAEDARRIFWLSGPAGAGKSAIAQSIAERCLDNGVPSAGFFFFRADPTRNHAAPLVATFIYQLVEICPAIKRRVHDFISENHSIFDRSVEQQLKALMFAALLYSGRPWPVKHRILLILDGLDECSSESKSWAVQQDILRTLHYVVTQKDSPFILLVSSRAEPHLTMIFNGIQSQVGRLYLEGDSFSSEDIRRFVTGELQDIKTMHHLASTLPAEWPAPDTIESIVRKSSGHFIYAATVIRFVQISSESPMLSLEKVEGIRPVEMDAPFAQLDAVYSHILSKAKKWVKARDILAAQTLPDPHDGLRSVIVYQPHAPTRSTVLLDALGYNISEIGSYTAELTALVKVDSKRKEVSFYHSSFGDFLLDKARSGEFFVDLDEFRLKLVPALFYCIGGVKDHLSWGLVLEQFTSLTRTNGILTQALSSSPLLSSGLAFTGPTLRLFLLKVSELYAETDAQIYRTILKKWLTWFHKNHGALHDEQLDDIEHAGKMWNELGQALIRKPKNIKGSFNAPDQAVLPTNSPSFSSAVESVISDILMRHAQSSNQGEQMYTIPEANIVGIAQESSRGVQISAAPSNEPPTDNYVPAKLGDTGEPVHEINPDDTTTGLGPGFSPIDEELEELKAGVVNLVADSDALRTHVFQQQQPGEFDRFEDPPSEFRAELPHSRHEEKITHRSHDQQEALGDSHGGESNISQQFMLYLSHIGTAISKGQPIPAARQVVEAHPSYNIFAPPPRVDDREDAQHQSTGVPPGVQENSEHSTFAEAQFLQDAYTEAIGSASAREILAIRADAEAATKEVAAVRAELASARLSLEAAHTEARSVLDSAKKEAQSIREESNKMAMSSRSDVFAARDELQVWLAVCTKIARAHTHIFARAHKSRPPPFGPPMVWIRFIAHIITVPEILRPPGVFTLRKLRAKIASPWEQSQSTPTPRS